MLLVPLIAFVPGFGWASFGILVAATMKSIDNFSGVTSTVVTPLFLVAGTFFPLSNLPDWAQVLGELNPLHHSLELVRDGVFGNLRPVDLLRLAALLAFGVVLWRLAIWRMTRRLID